MKLFTVLVEALRAVFREFINTQRGQFEVSSTLQPPLNNPKTKHMKYFIGAYAASPTHTVWDEKQEREYLEGIQNLKHAELVEGLEIPFFGSLHKSDAASYRTMLSSKWNHLLTLIPGVMGRLNANPHEGLASEDMQGRKDAIAFVHKALQTIDELHQWMGRSCVRGILIHSAPRVVSGISSSAQALAESLAEITSWNWGETQIMIEHCDQASREHVAEKGFLPLEAEIEAIQKRSVKILINWGRSAVEARNADLPAQQIKKLATQKILGGIMFSGTAENDELYGHWADSHAPFNRTLMTATRVVECLKNAAAKPDFLGFKIQALPKTLSVRERIDFVEKSLGFLHECVLGSRSN